MKFYSITLGLISFTTVSIVAQSPAFAGEGGARFKFAPNVWRNEAVRVPSSHNSDPVHSVRSGSVPKGSNFLGVDPQLLQKPVQRETQVAAQPSFVQAQPQMVLPKAQFSSSFGRPSQPKDTPVVAALPQSPAPLAAPQKAIQKPAQRRGGRGFRSNRDVHGVLAHTKRNAENGLSAQPGSTIESYGKNVGYVPGAYMPVSSGSGLRTEADVHGRVIRN